MDENAIRRRLLRLSILICLIGGILLVFGVGMVFYVAQSAHDAVHEQMQLEATEYKKRIYKQFDKDFQTLNTLASVLSRDRVLPSAADDMLSWIEEVNGEYNDFVSIAYFTPDGNGMVNTFGRESRPHYPLDLCDKMIQDAVKKSFAGENVLSRFFVSALTDAQLYAYSVPIWQDGEVIGALVASIQLDVFNEITNGDTVMGGNGFVHLIDAEGHFLVRSPKSVVPIIQEYTSIFDGPYIAQEERAATLSVMENQQSGFFEFQYENKTYHFYLQPLELNDWYLMCVDTMWGGFSHDRQILLIMGSGFLLMLILSCSLLFYGYFLMRKNYSQLIHLAYSDQVTGAENFVCFERRLLECQKQTESYSVVAANVRNFKFLNELFGTDAANRLLNYLRRQFELRMKENESFCRDTADQFYLLLRDTDKARISERLYDIISCVSEVSRKNGHGFDINLYCGVSVKGDAHQALLAQQYIRQNVNKRVHFYDTDIHKKELRSHYIESHMEQAIKNGEFKMYLQPKIRLSDGAVAGAEALTRWQTEDGEFLYPGEFIPLFESNGFCVRLDLYMVACACAQIRQWLDAGITPIPISVNQSKLLFMEERYVDDLKKLLAEYQIPASLIVLEILEDLAAENLLVLDNRIQQLHSVGFRISMDDFGSGYSSLNILYQLKLDELKIDQSFLRSATQKNNEKRWIVLHEIVQLAQKLNIATVIEGVETRENAEMMASFGCECAQGYFYSKPIRAEEFSEKYMR